LHDRALPRRTRDVEPRPWRPGGRPFPEGRFRTEPRWSRTPGRRPGPRRPGFRPGRECGSIPVGVRATTPGATPTESPSSRRGLWTCRMRPGSGFVRSEKRGS